MRKRKRKKFASIACNLNEAGFTFVSMLLSVTLLAISLPFFGYMIKTADYETNYDEISIHQFFQFVRDDVIRANDVHASKDRLYLVLNEFNDTATLELYGSRIRRQVNGQGHEIYLQDIADLSFTSLPYGVRISIVSISGEKYEKTIVYYE